MHLWEYYTPEIYGDTIVSDYHFPLYIFIYLLRFI